MKILEQVKGRANCDTGFKRHDYRKVAALHICTMVAGGHEFFIFMPVNGMYK